MSSNIAAKVVTIYLARHGESVGNLKRTFVPAEEDVLSRNGKLQVELLGQSISRQLQRQKITFLYASNYTRAIETAEAIAAAAEQDTSLQIIQDPRLQERNMGIFEGGSYQDALNALVSSGQSLVDYEVPEGETIEELYQRVSSFFKDLVEKIRNNKDSMTSQIEPTIIVIVSHSFALLKLLQYITESGDYKVTIQNSSGQTQKVQLKFLKNASYFKLNLTIYKHNANEEISTAESTASGNSTSTVDRKDEIEFIQLHETSHLQSLKSQDLLQKFASQQTDERAKKILECIQA